MFDYIAMQGTAAALIDSFGTAATFTRTTGSTFNPATGSYTGGTVVTIAGNAVRMDYAKGEIDGELVQRGDFKLLFGGAAGEPAIGDTVAFGGNNYRVMDVSPLSPAGVSVMYDVQCRR